MAGSKQLHRLSARRVETLRRPGRHGDGNNLFLSISAAGARRWTFLFRWGGRLVEMGLGSARDISLAQARARAAEARQLLIRGISPLEARRLAQASARPPAPVTFGEIADQLLAAMQPSRCNKKHHEQWRLALGARPPARGNGVYATPLRSLPVAEVTTEDVLKVLRPVWQSKPEQASRLRMRIEAVLDAARAGGHRSTENCARWKGHLDKLLPVARKLSRGHHAAMRFEDVPQFMLELQGCDGVTPPSL